MFLQEWIILIPLYLEKTKTIATGAIVDKKYYLHRDYLGSIIAISDDTGVAVERRQFDAWGNLAKLEQNGVAIALPTDLLCTHIFSHCPTYKNLIKLI